MDDESFARQLISWLDPRTLTECVTRYEADGAVVHNRLVICSSELRSGNEANFAELVAKFLRGFRIPRSLIELVQSTHEDLQVSPESWQWLQDLTLSAQIEACSRENVPSRTPPQTILLIDERDAVLDVIRLPILALLDLVGLLADHWRTVAKTVAKTGATVYHEHNMPSTFYAYVDQRVASGYLNLADPDFKGVMGPKNRYRAVTVFGCPHPDHPLWEMVQEMARQAAFSTHQPIEESDP